MYGNREKESTCNGVRWGEPGTKGNQNFLFRVKGDMKGERALGNASVKGKWNGT